jgi:hypothetical protein
MAKKPGAWLPTRPTRAERSLAAAAAQRMARSKSAMVAGDPG